MISFEVGLRPCPVLELDRPVHVVVQARRSPSAPRSCSGCSCTSAMACAYSAFAAFRKREMSYSARRTSNSPAGSPRPLSPEEDRAGEAAGPRTSWESRACTGENLSVAKIVHAVMAECRQRRKKGSSCCTPGWHFRSVPLQFKQAVLHPVFERNGRVLSMSVSLSICVLSYASSRFAARRIAHLLFQGTHRAPSEAPRSVCAPPSRCSGKRSLACSRSCRRRLPGTGRRVLQALFQPHDIVVENLDLLAGQQMRHR